MWREFKPTIYFLLKFLLVYGGLSLLYGWYMNFYDTADPPVTDPITRWVGVGCTHTAGILGYESALLPNDHFHWQSEKEQTFDSMHLDGEYAISIEEGCNGINIMIIFLSFVIAFGGNVKRMLIFLPAGILFIHLANLLRLFLLAWLNVEVGARAFHFFHKYGFTAVLYLVVLFLWFLWVMKFSGKITKKQFAEVNEE